MLDTQADFECMLDIRAFTIPPGDQSQPLAHPGIFYHKSWPFWPMHGDYFWATGRYVYDCTHVTTVKEKDQEKPDQPETEVDLHPALINPIKAFATARYEAALFDESDEPLPTTRFSFFSCRKGATGTSMRTSIRPSATWTTSSRSTFRRRRPAMCRTTLDRWETSHSTRS